MDIDRIQRELDATESFLRTRGQDVSTSSLRTSQQKSNQDGPLVHSFRMESSATVIADKKVVNEEVEVEEDTAAFGRYANPIERERLISRLLKEHNLKTGGPESTDTSRDADEDDRNTLFFASDLHHSSRIIPSTSHDSSSYPSGMTMKDRLMKELPEEFEEYSIPYSSADVGEDSDTFDRLSSGGNVSFVGSGRSRSNNSSNISSTRTRPLSAPPRTRETTFDNMGETYNRNRYPIPGSNKRQPSIHQSAVSRSLQDFGTTATIREDRMGEMNNDLENNRKVTSSSISWSIPVDATAGKSKHKRFLKSKEDIQKEAELRFKKLHAFKPTLTSTTTGKKESMDDGSGGVKSDPTMRLEDMNRRYQKSQSDLLKQKKEFVQKELKQCTFKPKVTKMAHRNPRNRSASPSFNAVQFMTGGTGYDTINTTTSSGISGNDGIRSYGPISGTYIKQKAKVQGLSSSIPPPPPPPDQSNPSIDTSRRLHEDAEQRIAQQRWLERQVENARHAQYTFQPAINPGTTAYFDKGLEHRPIHERIADIQRDKRERLKELKKECELDQLAGVTFVPQIDARSRKLAERRLDMSSSTVMVDDSRSSSHTTGEGNVSDRAGVNGSHMGHRSNTTGGDMSPDSLTDVSTRLYHDAYRSEMRKIALTREVELERAAAMEPPKVSKGTEKIALTSAKIKANFHDRQAMHTARVQKKHSDMTKAVQDEGATWFKPEIGKSSEIVANKRPSQSTETTEERVIRLSHADAIAMNQRRKAKDEEIYGGLTFVPAIDPVSKALGRSPNLKELVENKRGVRAKELAKQAVKKMEDEAYTFKPHVGKYPARYNNKDHDEGPPLLPEDSKKSGLGLADRQYVADTRPVSWSDCGMMVAEDGGSSSSVIRKSSSSPSRTTTHRNPWTSLPMEDEDRDLDDEALEPISRNIGKTSGGHSINIYRRNNAPNRTNVSTTSTVPSSSSPSSSSGQHQPPSSSSLSEGQKQGRQCAATTQPSASTQPQRTQSVPGYQRKCTVNLREPERMARDIRQQLNEKEERRRAELIAREIDEMRQCTFKPSIPSYQPSTQPSITASIYYESQGQAFQQLESPIIIKGLSRHLELQNLSYKQKEETVQRERDAFTVKNIDKFRRPEDGSTIVKPFVLSDIPTRPSRVCVELEEAEEAECTFHPTIPAASKDRINASVIGSRIHSHHRSVKT